jgi:hypothetical protein
MVNWINQNKKSIIRAAFLVPILLVATISISHVVRWYDLANPLSWAIYLSVAIEIAAMSAIAAASAKVKGFSVWFVFIIVTIIQFIGNIFFSYTEIDVNSQAFIDWSELTLPLVEIIGGDPADILSQKRWLAILTGGLLPLISLTCLHFFIKYGEISNEPNTIPSDNIEDQIEDVQDEPENPETLQEKPIKLDRTTIDSSTNNIQEDSVKPEVQVPKDIEKPTKEIHLSEKMKKIIKGK